MEAASQPSGEAFPSGGRRQARRVLPNALFETPRGALSLAAMREHECEAAWSGPPVPKSFNEAASGSLPSSPPHHVPGAVNQIPAQRPASVTSSDTNGAAKRRPVGPMRPSERAPLHARKKRFVRAGPDIIAHSPRAPALLEKGHTGSDAGETKDSQSMTASDRSRYRLLSRQDHNASSPEDELQLCASDFGTSRSGSSLFANGASSPPLDWKGCTSEQSMAGPEDEGKRRQEIEESPKAIHQEGPPMTQHSAGSIRHMHLQEEAMAGGDHKMGENEQDAIGKELEVLEEEDGPPHILDSPQLAHRRSALRTKIHQLVSHDTHEGIEEVDDHAYEKRAKLIRKRFKLKPWMVRERNMLWFAPPIEELQGQSLGMFGEWDPIRVLCVDLLRNTALQAAFFLINVLSIAALAARPAREAVVSEYDAFEIPLPACSRVAPGERCWSYYQLSNLYFIVEVVSFLTLLGEITLSVVARGLLSGHYAFVKDPFNVLDTVILVISFAEFILWAFGWTIILRGFRTLKILKYFMLINVAVGCKTVIAGIRRSLVFVQVLALIIIVLLLCFSAALPPLFGSRMSRRCVVERTDTEYMLKRFNNTARVRVARGRQNEFGYCEIRNSSISLLGWLTADDSCPKQFNADIASKFAGAGLNQVCDPTYGISDGGYGQVDTVWSALMAQLQASAGDAWYSTPYKLGQTSQQWKQFAWTVFAVPAAGCTLFLFPAIIALGARKYFEAEQEQKTDKRQFLNVLGSAETHQQEENRQHHAVEEEENAEGDSPSIKSGNLASPSRPLTSVAHNSDQAAAADSVSVSSKVDEEAVGFARAPAVPAGSKIVSPLKSALKNGFQSQTSPLKSPLKETLYSVISRRSYMTSTSHKTATSNVSSHVPEPVSRTAARVMADGICCTAVLLNVVILIIELEDRSRGGLSHSEDSSNLSSARWGFSLFFMVEVLVRIAVRGSIYKYFRSVTSTIDFVIVFVDAAGMFAVALGSQRWHVLRGVAAVRLYRIMLRTPASCQLLHMAASHVLFMFSALAVPTTLIVASTITAHHWFGEGLIFGDKNQFSYFSFGESFRMLMHVSTGDKWREVVYGSLQAASNAALTSRLHPDPDAIAYIGVLFLVGVFYTFRFWLHGLFIGVIGECFNLQEMEQHSFEQMSRLLGPIWDFGRHWQQIVRRKIEAQDRAASHLMGWAFEESFKRTQRFFKMRFRRIFPYWDMETGPKPVVPDGHKRVTSKPRQVSEARNSPDYEVFGDAVDSILSAPRRPPVLGHPDHTSLWVPVVGGLRYKNPIRVFCRVMLGSNFWKLLINTSVLLSSVFIFIGEAKRTSSSLSSRRAQSVLTGEDHQPLSAATSTRHLLSTGGNASNASNFSTSLMIQSSPPPLPQALPARSPPPPLPPAPGQEDFWAWIDAETPYKVFTGVYTMEFALHVLAQGLLFPPRSYLREAESLFDFSMLTLNLVDVRMTEGGSSSPLLRVLLLLRLFRLFRPPRPFKNGEGMIYHSVMGATVWLTLVVIFTSFVYLVFAVIGMEIFSGQLHSCSCSHLKFPQGRNDCLGSGISGMATPGVYGDLENSTPYGGDGFLAPCSWHASETGHFDTFWGSMLALSRIAGRKWSDLFQACTSIAGRGRQPVSGERADLGLFFAAFIAASSLLTENLIAAFMIQGFGRGLHFRSVSKQQLQIEAIERLIFEVRPRMPRQWPQNKLSILCRHIIKSIWFRRISSLLMLVHSMLLLSQHGGMDEGFQEVIANQNHVFFAILCAETLLSILAFGFKNFVAVPFHWLDLVLISVGIYSYSAGIVNELAFLRVLRVFRLFTVVAPKHVALAYVNEMFSHSMSMVLQALSLLVIALIIFALVGSNLLSNIRPGTRLGASANFDTFGMSVVTLVQIVLGDEWHQLMLDCSVRPPFCDASIPGLQHGDCGTSNAPFFFVAWMIVVNAVCLNMVVASFVDGLQYSRMKRSTLGPFPNIQIETELRKFSKHWTAFDPGGTRKMKVSIVPSFLLQLPKPLGFGKISKMQKLSGFQRTKSLSICTELSIVAGLCDGIAKGSPVLLRIKQVARFVWRTFLKVICCCIRGRKKKRQKATGPQEEENVDYEAASARLFLLNSGNMGKSYYPEGHVDPFWLNIALGETVSYEQVLTAVLAHMIPDYLSAERLEARANLHKAITGVVRSVQIATFCRRCINADAMRHAAASRRVARWREWALTLLNTKLGMISSITAMGFGTWEDQGGLVVQEPPKMEAEVEMEIVDKLIKNCEIELKEKDCDEKALTFTLLALHKRKMAAQALIDEAASQREEEERKERERKQAMQRRVQDLCDKGYEILEAVEDQLEKLKEMGPITSDVHIDSCMGEVAGASALLVHAEDVFDKAVKAGAYYSLRGDADDGVDSADEKRHRLQEEEERLLMENVELRRPLRVFANFVRLENANEFAMLHDHDRLRKLDQYFATVLLQAYARKKQERVRFCALRTRSEKGGGRFVPVSSQASLAMGPLDHNHQHIVPHRAGLLSHRVALMRQQQLQEHLGFSLMSPTSPISPTSPLRADPRRSDAQFVAEQIMSPRGMLYRRGRHLQVDTDGVDTITDPDASAATVLPGRQLHHDRTAVDVGW